MLSKLYYSAVAWTAIGLAGGLFYREFTKMNDFTGPTHLSLVHTHALALGTLFFLVALALEKAFDLGAYRQRNPAYLWVMNAGLALTVVMFAVKGVLQVTGNAAADHAAVAGMHGLGHMIITAGLILFLIDLRRGMTTARAESLASAP